MKYVDHTVYKTLNNAELLDKNGFFVGNSHVCLNDEITYLYNLIKDF